MTQEEFATAYQSGFTLTVRFLVSRGLNYDAARETAQAAWAKGWERLQQLRNPGMILTWMNTIALNIHRTHIRRDPFEHDLPELSSSPADTLNAIDARRILRLCRKHDRQVLEWHYLEGYKVQEIALRQGVTETAVRIRLLRARRTAEERARRSTERSTRSVAHAA